MRAGQLNTPADLLALGIDLQPQVLGLVWVGIRSKDAGDPPAPVGLRAQARVEVRAWYDERLLQGRYLRADSRLLHLISVRDFKGDRSELVMTCEELVGEVAQYTPASGGAAVPCRVFLTHGVARVGDVGRTEYTTQLEAALVEVGRPQPGALFVVGGETWRVAGLVEDEDDRVVRRMWVKRP